MTLREEAAPSRALVGALVLAVALVAGCARGGGATERGDPDRPYAGLEARPIKALAPERVTDLLAGRGAGYALAAELNRYPGPRHVLEQRAALDLRPEQEARVRAVFAAMEQEAQRHGRELVALEAELDRAFAGGAVTPAELARLTAALAAVEGRLRHTHLAAHLETKAVLSAEQVARYDRLRGYTGAAARTPESGHHGAAGHGR